MKSDEPKIVPLRSRDQRPELLAAPGALTFDQALGAHLDALYATARILSGNVAVADDLVQETALRALRAWGDLRSPDAVKSWLLRILHRTFLNARRHEARRPPIVDIDIDELQDHPILGVEPDAASGGAVVSDELVGALDSLPLGFREVVWLVDAEELPLAEVARILEVPMGTVASRAHRARRLLRERLGKGGK